MLGTEFHTAFIGHLLYLQVLSKVMASKTATALKAPSWEETGTTQQPLSGKLRGVSRVGSCSKWQGWTRRALLTADHCKALSCSHNLHPFLPPLQSVTTSLNEGSSEPHEKLQSSENWAQVAGVSEATLADGREAGPQQKHQSPSEFNPQREGQAGEHAGELSHLRITGVG